MATATEALSIDLSMILPKNTDLKDEIAKEIVVFVPNTSRCVISMETKDYQLPSLCNNYLKILNEKHNGAVLVDFSKTEKKDKIYSRCVFFVNMNYINEINQQLPPYLHISKIIVTTEVNNLVVTNDSSKYEPANFDIKSGADVPCEYNINIGEFGREKYEPSLEILSDLLSIFLNTTEMTKVRLLDRLKATKSFATDQQSLYSFYYHRTLLYHSIMNDNLLERLVDKSLLKKTENGDLIQYKYVT